MIKVLTKRERIILYTTIGIIIFALGFNFLIAPLLTKNENLNREIVLSRTKLKKYLRLLSQKDYIEKKYNKFSTPLKGSQEGTDAFVNALSELENLAKAANIRIVDIRPQSAKSLALYKETLIDLRTEGTMEGYLKFIYNLENSLSLLRIKRFQLNAKPNSPTLEGSFSVSQLSLD
jgi:hypothetical protein